LKPEAALLDAHPAVALRFIKGKLR